MTAPEPVYLTTKRQFCAELGVSWSTVRRWVEKGAPIGVEKNARGALRYRAEKHALMRWLIERKEEAGKGKCGE